MIVSIARHELVEQWRHKTIKILMPLMLLLTGLVAVSHWQQQQDFIAIQQQWQDTNDQAWQAQPDRHPHRASHYGTMVFRQISALSFLDAGVNPYVGNVLFLEAHRQNSSQFKQYSISHSYMQLGYLSGASLILIVWPLVLIALAYKSISGDRQQGTLRQIIALGVSLRRIMLGKVLAYSIISSLFLVMVFIIAILFLAQSEISVDTVTRFSLLFIIYWLYCLIWAGMVVLISLLSAGNNQSLSTALLVWLIMVVILPKFAYGIAEYLYPTPDQAVFNIQTSEAIAKVGDSHNPDDPYFKDFRQRTLQHYGVTKLEDLPVSWKGLLMQEGERVTSEVFDQQYQLLIEQLAKQNDWVANWSVFSPYLISSQLSAQLSGTSYQQIKNYEQAAEAYRYQFIQSLNDLHIHQVKVKDNKEQRISKDHWSHLAGFHYHAPHLLNEIHTMLISMAVFILWCISILFSLFSIRPKVTLL
jgi:ABC-2 type transport system permease protein